jgi:hypothetical protein
MATKGVLTMHTLTEGTGLSWREVAYSRMDDAQDISETTELDNPEQAVDTLFTVTPTLIGKHTFITDRVALRISKNAFAQLGGLAQRAIQRKKDKDGLTMLDAATTSLPGAGQTLTSGVISAMTRRIASNTTEPVPPPYTFVAHGHQIHDIDAELRAAIGSVEITSGETSRAFREGFRGTVGGARVVEDGNIAIDSLDDAKGGVLAVSAAVLVQGRNARSVPVRNEKRGGGGTDMYLYDEYAYGIRISAGVYEVYSDATAPTS